MTQEEKNILLKDLCGRIPYNVFCEYTYVKPILHTTISSKGIDILSCKMIYELDLDENLTWGMGYYSELKPYLRPMNSMTEEEEREYNAALKPLGDFMFEQEELFTPIQLYKSIPFALYEFFIAHHFDYRGLIPMGLALPAKEGMYMKGGEE